MFACEPLAAGELVAVWGGKIYTTAEVEEISKVAPQFATHPITIYPGYSLGSEDLFGFDDTEYFNHSCRPNVGIKGSVILVARDSIEAGEELTFDYDTTETEVLAPFQCACSAPDCRGWIDGSAWKDPAWARRNAGFLAWHVEESIRRAQERNGGSVRSAAVSHPAGNVPW